MIGRAAAHPHGFLSGDEGLVLLSIQIPRPAEGAITWDQPGETTEPVDCAGWDVPAVLPVRGPQLEREGAPVPVRELRPGVLTARNQPRAGLPLQ